MAKADIHFIPDENILKAVAKVIKTERMKRQLTQEALGTESNVTWRHIQRFESGQLNPSLCSFIKIAGGLGIAPDELLKKVVGEIK